MVTNPKQSYGSRFVVRDDGTNDPEKSERIWAMEILGKHGTMYPYGYDGTLAVRVESRRLAKKLEAMGYQVRQRGDWEVVFLFPLKDFELIAGLVGARKRRQLGPEARAKLVERLKGAQNGALPPLSKPVKVPEEGPSQAPGHVFRPQKTPDTRSDPKTPFLRGLVALPKAQREP